MNAPALPQAGFDPDDTILIPQPGGRVAERARTEDAPRAPALTAASGLNPLVRAANPLIELALPLRQRAAMTDIEALRSELVRMVRAFEEEARASRIDTEKLAAARYCLCTCIDEAISGTPWGSGVWASRSLLVTFHNEASGGERFFLILQRLAQDPARNIDVLELLYVILSLGFEGRYRLIDGGRSQLDSVRERLERIIRDQRGAFENELSVHWRPAERARRPLGQRMPPWVCAALAGVVVVATHIALAMSLNRTSDPVFEALDRIRVSERPAAPASVIAPAAMPAAAANLAAFLAPEIREGLVSVREAADRSIVTINGDNLFASGSATLDPAYDTLIGRIAQALAGVPGKVVVTGHTDDQRLVSARFPSNWHLSQARADSVRAMLASLTGTPARFSAEGRGDAEPLASNDTPAGRAKNRRVEITLLAPGASS
ncbi:DotU family type VI secretion system protein [Caballeronia novacaledonica]|uniref:DotU family type VI secretion system protein n=1 Tax=Caballeronia novacaledonica TaxID=1544861 RepID=A0AA37MS26_9BURK|nr:DotU family type VI secretion system protein [Caballeronia novacaledonica]GJH25184.1 DotU family type VI secretion system protein [Caballeronia novacaledonica]